MTGGIAANGTMGILEVGGIIGRAAHFTDIAILFQWRDTWDLGTCRG